ncbi:hypothetical protein HPB50_007696 [Hyalomma asiaticum]|uniref:Uncharacterized protein n=1 Tax=Hyalomma asiaticum TaxID=266040 RepID=A0ACB7TIS2_HYAAI|nr:hypothetical protein HPB50_007696 [Hyalomma asiaticum]
MSLGVAKFRLRKPAQKVPKSVRVTGCHRRGRWLYRVTRRRIGRVTAVAGQHGGRGDAPSEKAGLEPGLSGVMRAAVDVAVLARAPSAAVDGRRWLAARDGTAEAREQRDGLPARQASHGRVPPSGEERDRGSCAPLWKRAPPRSNTRRGRRADWDRCAMRSARAAEGGSSRPLPRCAHPRPHPQAPPAGGPSSGP